jgi:hypothetical protein
MEDYIPLIIVILISIIGAISCKKKRLDHENISAPNQRIQRDEDFLDRLEKLNIVEDNSPIYEERSFLEIDKNEVVPVKVVVAENPVIKESTPIIFSKYSGFNSPEEREDLMSKEGTSTITKRGVSEGDLTQQTLKESELIEAKTKFVIDLRKAVIYN